MSRSVPCYSLLERDETARVRPKEELSRFSISRPFFPSAPLPSSIFSSFVACFFPQFPLFIAYPAACKKCFKLWKTFKLFFLTEPGFPFGMPHITGGHFAKCSTALERGPKPDSFLDNTRVSLSLLWNPVSWVHDP